MRLDRTVAHPYLRWGLLAGIVAFILAAGAACSSDPSTVSPGQEGDAEAEASTDATNGNLGEGGGAEGAMGDSGAVEAALGEGSVAEAADTPDAAASADGRVDASVSDAAAEIVVTSPAFAEGQAIPSANTCAGADVSPEIDWTAGPAAAQSYALVVSDLTATANIHWVIWDISTGTHSLPAMLPGDPILTSPVSAKQVDLRTTPEAGTTTNGFFGPCPRGATHSYEFALHAIDVATLPGVTTESRSADVKAVVLMHSLAEGALIGTSNAAPPTGGGPVDAGGP